MTIFIYAASPEWTVSINRCVCVCVRTRNKQKTVKYIFTTHIKNAINGGVNVIDWAVQDEYEHNINYVAQNVCISYVYFSFRSPILSKKKNRKEKNQSRPYFVSCCVIVYLNVAHSGQS